ncbi:MAG: hypothetical protein M0Q21_04925 [Ignavibacteriaceae bacterium]|nr:hypothetical protein [Ignavibacteriaceae bacterium]
MQTIFFLSLLSLFPSFLFSQDSALFTPEKRKAFADHLFCEKDYLRASEEYEGLQSVNKSDSLSYYIGLCFLKMNDYEKAKDYFSQLKNSSLGEESRLLFLKTSFLLNKNIEGESDSSSNQFMNKELKTSFRRLELAAQIKAGMDQTNPLSLNNHFEESDAQILKSFADKFSHPNSKSPFAAALFSTLLPGAGKIYTKNYGDGITSLIVTGLFTFLWYDNFRAGHPTRAWIFAGLTGFFYWGSVYGSYISARNYNLEKEEELNNEFQSYLSSKNYFIPTEIEGSCK